jgi:hypothetical protein
MQLILSAILTPLKSPEIKLLNEVDYSTPDICVLNFIVHSTQELALKQY